MRGNWVRGGVYLGHDTATGTAMWINSLSPADALQRTGRKEGGVNSGDPQNWALGTKGRDEGKLNQM